MSEKSNIQGVLRELRQVTKIETGAYHQEYQTLTDLFSDMAQVICTFPTIQIKDKDDPKNCYHRWVLWLQLEEGELNFFLTISHQAARGDSTELSKYMTPTGRRYIVTAVRTMALRNRRKRPGRNIWTRLLENIDA